MNWKKTAHDFVTDIQNRTIFSFSRWGDGEWTSLIGKKSPKNCDKHRYSARLTASLKEALQTPGPRIGVTSMAQRMYRLECSPAWYDADIFHNEEKVARREHRTSMTLDLFRSRKGFSSTVVVGPDCYRKLESLFSLDDFVEVPRLNCFDDVDRIIDGLHRKVQSLPQPVLVSISASMAANVIVHRLFPSLGNVAWLLDLGSLWLPYIPDHGLRLRSGQRERIPIV